MKLYKSYLINTIHTPLFNSFSDFGRLKIKGTVRVISSEPLLTDGNVRFTTVP